jgi:hypothetical protein
VKYGATVTGVELDPALAAKAREMLAADGIGGVVIEADFASVPIEAEVVFAFLSPATLQRLRPRLEALPPGTRVVTTGYAIPGWVPHDLRDRCFLYRLPANEADVIPDARGWVSAGAVVALPPDAPSLVAVKVHHSGGPVSVTVAGVDLSGWATVRTGTDHASPGDPVTVDLRFEPRPLGTQAAGTLETAGAEPFRVFAVADSGEVGIWGLSGRGCDLVAELMERDELAAFLDDARRRTTSES